MSLAGRPANYRPHMPSERPAWANYTPDLTLIPLNMAQPILVCAV